MDYTNNAVSAYLDYALLAKAAYKDLKDTDASDLDAALSGADSIYLQGEYKDVKSYFTGGNGGLARYMKDEYDLVKTFDDPHTGFFAMLVRDNAGDYTLAIRGTEFENDMTLDLLATDTMIGNYGIAMPQVASLKMALDEVKQLTNGAPIKTTGHSLGGHLSLMAKALYPDFVSDVYTFNAPHLNLLALDAAYSDWQNSPGLGLVKYFQFSQLSVFADPDNWDSKYKSDHVEAFNDIMNDAPQFSGRLSALTNLHIVETDGDIVSDLGTDKFGQPQMVYSEFENDAAVVLSAIPHSMSGIASSLLVHSLFNAVDSTLTANDIGEMIRSLSDVGYNNSRNPSLEEAVRIFSEYFFGVDYAAVPELAAENTLDGSGNVIRNGEYENVEAFQTTILQLKSLLEERYGGEGPLVNLAKAQNVASLAMVDDERGRAYRYALVNLHPFTIISGYDDDEITSSSYNAENFSEEYIDDRLLFLSKYVEGNAGDNHPSMIDEEAVLFTDRATGIKVFAGQIDIATPGGGQTAFEETEVSQYAFGDDEGNNISGYDKDDHLYGMGGKDTITAGAGNDYLEGGKDNDFLDGGDDVDTLVGGEGNDYINGGEGDDILLGGEGNDYYFYTAGDGHDTITDTDKEGVIYYKSADGTLDTTFIKLNRYNQTQWGGTEIAYSWQGNGSDLVITFDEGAGSITVKNFNNGDLSINIIDGEIREPINHINGDANNNTLTGTVGNDNITGHDGVDVLYGLGGDDQLVGDAAGDWGRFQYDLLYGGAGNDSLFASDGGSYQEGGSGNDNLHGGASVDELYGGAGSDTISSGTDFLRDVIDGQEGHDYLYGGWGDDVYGGSGNDYILGEGAKHIWGGSGHDRIIGGGVIEGGQGYDTLRGSANATLSGGEDHDTYIYGEDGNITLIDSRDNTLRFLPGISFNTLSLNVVSGALQINTGSDNNTITIEGFDPTDPASLAITRFEFSDGSVLDAEQFLGTGSYVAAINTSGDAGDNEIAGNWTDDTLGGGAGTDTLSGGGGVDTYIYNRGDGIDTIIDSGSNTLRFGEGISFTDISLAIGSLQINTGAPGDEIHIEGFDPASPYDNIAVDRFEFADGSFYTYEEFLAKGLELNGTNLDDSLAGTASPDRISGFEGKDYITGGEGNDILFGGIGDDVLIAESGNDEINGGDGNDWLRGDGDHVAAEDHGDDTLSGGAGNDFLVGYGGNDSLDGGDGADNLDGGDGDDTLIGGTGNDVLVGQAGSDLLDAGDGDDWLRGDWDTVPIEDQGDDILSGGAGSDRLYGYGGNDSVHGGSGEDTLNGGKGSDNLIGGDGLDTYIFNIGDGADVIADSGVNILQLGAGISAADLSFSTATGILSIGADDAGDNIHFQNYDIKNPFNSTGIDQLIFADGTTLSLETLIAVNEVAGSNRREILTGTELSDWISGFGGNDIVYAGSGHDFIIGGAGRDRLFGEAGDDTFLVEGTDRRYDTFNGGEGVDTVLGGAGDDTIRLRRFNAKSSIEAIDGGGGTNVIAGTRRYDKIDLSTTAVTNIDRIDLGAGNDTFIGTSGNDTIIGGRGRDVLKGGTGDDIYQFERGDGRDSITDRDVAGNSDTLMFGEGIDRDQLWFRRKGDHLAISVIGTSDQVTIKHWYTDAAYQVENIQFSDGEALLNSQVQQLVDAMAAFDPLPFCQLTFSDTKGQAFEAVLAVKTLS